jgi:anthranilate synthase component 1
MYYPTMEEVKKLKKQGNLVPVYKEIVADLETPVSAFLKISDGDYAFLLESVEGGERLARYSFIGADPYLLLQSNAGDGDPLIPIETELKKHKVVPVRGLPPFHGGAVGYLSYEVVRHFEELPSPDTDTLGLPESVFMFADTVLVFDHLSHKIKVVSHAHLHNGDVEVAYNEATARIDALVEKLNRPLDSKHSKANGKTAKAATSNMSQSRYEAIVAKAKEHIVAGDIIQAVLSQRLSKQTSAQPFDIYRSLRSINPSPYMYYLKLNDSYIIGTSPELLVRVENGTVATHPIAGTRPRGLDTEQDATFEAELKADVKEQAEHIMLVDLGRNDIGRIAEPGSVEVTQFMDVERYSHVMHLVSHVQGKLRGDLTQFDALRACFPAGTVSGAPKIRAMELIAELEPDRRGPYAGAVGYFSFSGNLDTAITIRTIVMKDGTANVQAGAGIVYDSVPEREHQECLNKAKALMKAIEVAEEAYVTADR